MEYASLKDSHSGSNGTSAGIDSLVHKIYNTMLEHKEAQLKTLQNQINPHFLYNTLESIRGAALYHGIDTIAEMAKRLSLFFRYSISNNVLVTLQDEIQNLENYIAVQNFRHDNKFELIYNISERQLQFKILKLILQPLVEFSIKRELELKLTRGIIKIEIVEEDHTIKVIMFDDGAGIPIERIKELNNRLGRNVSTSDEPVPIPGNGKDPFERAGIEVENANSRIKLYFGKKYGIKYKECDNGTTVEITLPVVN
jgi:two-component system sensor histidine kinase YesM